jgi:hypothetical protein
LPKKTQRNPLWNGDPARPPFLWRHFIDLIRLRVCVRTKNAGQAATRTPLRKVTRTQQGRRSAPIIMDSSKPIPLSEVIQAANLPRWKNGWTDSEGNQKSGFWYVWFDGRKISLTKYGAPNQRGRKPSGDPGRAELNAAIAARDRYLAEYVEKKADEFNQKQSMPGTKVRVVDCMNYYITHHLSKVKNTKERRRYCENFATGRDGGKNGILPYKGFGRLPVEELTHDHMNRWLEAHPTWGWWGRRKAIGVIKTAINFSARPLGIPVAGSTLEIRR